MSRGRGEIFASSSDRCVKSGTVGSLLSLDGRLTGKSALAATLVLLIELAELTD